MSAERTETHAVKAFQCLGAACPDTCCKGWDMQVAQQTADMYQARAPELLNAIRAGEHSIIMKRDPGTDYCVKFDAGWCSIHRDYGPEFLGDACHFYPRITRALDSMVVTGIAMSCPEAARLLLYGDEVFGFTPREELRVPFSLRNYLPQGLEAEEALALHQKFLEEAGNPSFTPERNVLRILEVARAFESQPVAQWSAAANFYFGIAESRLAAPEPNANDLTHLTQALMGLILASGATHRTGLMAIAQQIQDVLGVAIDPATRGLVMASDALPRGLKLLHDWAQQADGMRPVLTRYLQAQISQALFPLAGLGATLSERMTIIAVRFATVKLALMTQAQAGALTPEEVVRITYTLSRFLDHLADPSLSMAMYAETGWVRTGRLRALLGDH